MKMMASESCPIAIALRQYITGGESLMQRIASLVQ
jgi:hypothetical protein